MKTLNDRLWSKVDKGGECWVWTGAKTRSTPNYVRGNMKTGTGWDRPHRVAWTLVNGAIPPGMCVLHRCDNPLCCRPEHLFLGTHRDNTADMIAKGRRGDTTKPGEANRFAKLTDAQVLKMRSLGRAGITYTELARRFPVARETIRKILLGQKWKHLLLEEKA